MRNITIFVFVLVATLCSAQNSATVQPKIMAMPYVTEGNDIRQTIETDPNIRIVLPKIREAFDKRGSTTIDFATKLKAQSDNNALSDNDFKARGYGVTNAFSTYKLPVLAHIADIEATYFDEKGEE